MSHVKGTSQVTEESLSILLEENEPVLRAFVQRRIPIRLRPAIGIDDILQEVWVDAFRELPGSIMTENEALVRWLNTVARRKIVNAVRAIQTGKRGGRALPQEDTAILDFIKSVVSSERAPSSIAAVSEAGTALHSALCALTPSQHQAIRLRYIEGHPLESVARIMDKSAEAVRSMIFRGLKELEEKLGDSARYLSGDGVEKSARQPHQPLRGAT